MKDPEAPRTGIIECEKGSASFYMNDFSFCFMNNTIKRITKRSGEIYSAANLLFALKKQGNFYVGVTNPQSKPTRIGIDWGFFNHPLDS